jgi:2-polyprenyl-6-methoxyphenol hydroxylase-like FAD-dependent oxidoreductase
MTTHTPVLIVGAGPTGLMLAAVLQRYSVPFRIIDKKTEPTKTSNALGLQARTLELLDDLGIVEPFLQQGQKIEGAALFADGNNIANIDITSIDCRYQHITIMPQSMTEKALTEHLEKNGATIERGCELVNLSEQENQVTANIKMAGGSTDDFTADWVVACDGSHSIVRKLTGAKFKGDDISQQFILGDVSAKESTVKNVANNKISSFFSSLGILAIFPMPSGEYRIVANLQNKMESPNLSDIQKIVADRSSHHLEVKDASWISTFWIHSKVIENMRHGNIFFAGDAAHIHSPVGGQGMNTGMQDAYNLGWKLAYVIQQKAKEKILDSYHAERYPIIKGVVNQTERMTKMMLINNPIISSLRKWIMKPLLKCKKINDKLAMQITQLSLHYIKSPIIHYDSVISSKSPAPGENLPNVGEFTQNPKHQLLIFTGTHPTDKNQEDIKKLSEKIAQDYSDIIDVKCVSEKPDFPIHQRFNVERSALCLLRPDKYIAFASNRLDDKGLKKYLVKYFH